MYNLSQKQLSCKREVKPAWKKGCKIKRNNEVMGETMQINKGIKVRKY